MIRAEDIKLQAKSVGLALRGIFEPEPDAALPSNTKTLVLLGPDEPVFWGVFQASDEYQDRQADPMDRWSKRVATDLAAHWGGDALFPSDGPPFPPFLQWATASGSAWSSPVGLLVHDQAGLFISYRCAIALPYVVPTAAVTPARPCPECHRPCETACPVGAIGPGSYYDVQRCKAHLRSAEGASCRFQGCLVRRACPVSKDFSRLDKQSAFHMAAFLKN